MNFEKQSPTPGLFLSSLRIPCESELDLEPGTSLLSGRYTIKKCLGTGGFSATFLAHDDVRGEEVALKIAEAGPCDPEIARLVLENESRIYSIIGGHPHILRVHDLHYIPWHRTGLLAMSMEVADGESFRHWLLRKKHDRQTRLNQGLDYFKQMCNALSAVHQANTVHLDIKPENFLFVRGRLKLADHGAARTIQTLQLTTGVHVPSIAHRIGTPAYMSPELLTAAHPEDVDQRVDIYSLGCVGYEIFSKRCHPPFGGSFDELRERHLCCTPPPLEDVSERIARVVARCLEKI